MNNKEKYFLTKVAKPKKLDPHYDPKAKDNFSPGSRGYFPKSFSPSKDLPKGYGHDFHGGVYNEQQQPVSIPPVPRKKSIFKKKGEN